MGPTTSPSTPLSSQVSRSAVASGVSPGSMWPLGKIQSVGSFFARTSRTDTPAAPGRTTMPPACSTFKAHGSIWNHKAHKAHKAHKESLFVVFVFFVVPVFDFDEVFRL